MSNNASKRRTIDNVINNYDILRFYRQQKNAYLLVRQLRITWRDNPYAPTEATRCYVTIDLEHRLIHAHYSSPVQWWTAPTCIGLRLCHHDHRNITVLSYLSSCLIPMSAVQSLVAASHS